MFDRLVARAKPGSVLWALFGNDDDGVWGEKIPPGAQPGFGVDYPQTSSQFWKWWGRNKMHNLCFHTRLFRPVVKPLYIIGRPAIYSTEFKKTIVLRFRPFCLKIGFFLCPFSVRADEPIKGAWSWGDGRGGKCEVLGAFKRLT